MDLTFNMSDRTGNLNLPLRERQLRTHVSQPVCGVNGKFPIDGWDAVRSNGYVAIPQATFSRLTFTALSNLVDEIAFAPWTADARRQLRADATEWNGHPANTNRMSGAPVGLTDRRPREEKSQKAYLQICAEFAFFLRGKADSSYHLSPAIRALVDASVELADLSESVFREAVMWMPPEERQRFDASGAMSGRLPVMLKYLSYFPDPNWATPLHYDKSALTQVLYADDAYEETFVIGPHQGHKPTMEELLAPERFAVDPTTKGTSLLFPGMLMRQIGIKSIPPSPHGVMPVKKEGIRHSVIAFLLVPRLNTSELQTTLTDL